MNEQHIRPVPDPPQSEAEKEQASEPAATTSAKAEGRKITLPRANRPLPTDRMKFDTQVEALKAMAIVSEFGKRAISGEEMASMMGVVSTTAGLNNAFFADAGLATREGRGRYKPTNTASMFARKASFDPREAGLLLGPVLMQSWFYGAVERRLAMGTATREQVIETLAHEAGATKQRQPQLNSLLDWLQYAGVIDARGAHVTLTNARPQAEKPDDEKTNGDAGDGAQRNGQQTPDGAASAGATKSQRRSARQDSEVALSFSIDFAFTVDDLSKLTPEQIRALYESVGNVIAIKASVT